MHHLELLIEYRDGLPVREQVHAEHLGNGRFCLLHSPGLVLGIAAGDEFIFEGEDGAFHVLKRGGNLSITLYSADAISPHLEQLKAIAASISGTLDGSTRKAAILTVPVRVGFPAVETALNSYCSSHPELEWYYGNVYDPRDGVTPLRWWEPSDQPPSPDGL